MEQDETIIEAPVAEVDPILDHPKVKAIIDEATKIIDKLYNENGDLKACLATIRAGYMSIHGARKLANDALKGQVVR